MHLNRRINLKKSFECKIKCLNERGDSKYSDTGESSRLFIDLIQNYLLFVLIIYLAETTGAG